MIKQLQIFLLIAILALGAFVSTSYADKILFFSPTRVLLNDNDKVEVINISNLSEIARAYKISFQDLVMTEDGITTPVDVNTDYVNADGSLTPATPRRTIYIYRELSERTKDYNFASLEAGGSAQKIKLTLYDSPSADARPLQEVVLDIP